MKKNLFAVVAGLFALPAMAADLPIKAPPMVTAPAPYSWTGAYVGGNVGYAWGRDKVSQLPEGVLLTFTQEEIANYLNNGRTTLNPSGFTGGIGAGYNWQTGLFVFGLETDIAYTDLNSDSVSGPFTPSLGAVPYIHGQSVKADFLGTIRGRVGVAFDRSFVYATGGFAYAGVRYTNYIDYPGHVGFRYEQTERKTAVGWTVGGGYEVKLWDKWSGKIEYLYADLGSQEVTAFQNVPGSPNFYVFKNEFTEQLVRVGLNYHF
jgi:outer membrane immunogenic protein